MKTLFLLTLSLVVFGCATAEEKCAQPGVADTYGGFDHCVTAKKEQKRAIANGLFPTQAPASQSTQEKQVDYSCVNNCTARGGTYNLCQSKCSY